jgi:exodeoxyribonuclease VII small subunit
MSKSNPQKPVQDLTFEQALAELEKIVASLEAEQNPLDQAMQYYERGQALIVRCSELLEAAQLKVQKLSGDALLPYNEEEE